MNIEVILLLVLTGLYVVMVALVWYLMNEQLIEERNNIKTETVELVVADPDTKKYKEKVNKLIPLTLKSKKKEVEKIINE